GQPNAGASCGRRASRLQTQRYMTASTPPKSAAAINLCEYGRKSETKHRARRKSFDDAQLFNPEQDQRGPNVIEKLNCHEQNPERNFVSFRSTRESNAVMSDKHECLIVEAFVPNAFLSALDTSAATTVTQLATSPVAHLRASKLFPLDRLEHPDS